MSKKNRAAKTAPAAAEVAATFDAAMALVFQPDPEPPTLADLPVEIDAEVEADNAKPSSVVRTAYKKRYAERAASAGLGKVAQRSCWDWLAQERRNASREPRSRSTGSSPCSTRTESTTPAGRTAARAGKAGSE